MVTMSGPFETWNGQNLTNPYKHLNTMTSHGCGTQKYTTNNKRMGRVLSLISKAASDKS